MILLLCIIALDYFPIQAYIPVAYSAAQYPHHFSSIHHSFINRYLSGVHAKIQILATLDLHQQKKKKQRESPHSLYNPLLPSMQNSMGWKLCASLSITHHPSPFHTSSTHPTIQPPLSTSTFRYPFMFFTFFLAIGAKP